MLYINIKDLSKEKEAQLFLFSILLIFMKLTSWNHLILQKKLSMLHRITQKMIYKILKELGLLPVYTVVVLYRWLEYLWLVEHE